jgi:hypothetical protein
MPHGKQKAGPQSEEAKHGERDLGTGEVHRMRI